MSAEVFTRRLGRGSTVLLLHGQPGTGDDWAAVSPLLTGRHRLIVPDRPGYGRSPGPAVGITGNADIAASLLDGEATPAVVVGHSYGAAVALRLAELHPGLVAGLVLVAPAATPAALDRFDLILGSEGAGTALSFALVRGAGLAARALTLAPPSGWALLARRTGADPTRMRALAGQWANAELWRSFAVEQRSMVWELPAVEDALGSISAPTVVLAGTRDRLVPRAATEALLAALPEARLRWTRGGHLVPWRDPVAVAQAVDELSS
ncbi:MAG TPA: alpha/beta hydrolase [Acidimicrobiales bacterium]|nr:alpha/beta hydrolase [Acidimicrobiales bacterium]